MPDPVAIQGPLLADPAVELARDSRLFRKQVLRSGAINYQGRRLDFSGDYLDGLVRTFAEQPYPMVPLVFADADNRHTQDVERIRGEIIGLERTDSGIDAIVRASNDQAARLLRENPKIGCSVRIEQPLERADGKRWDAALHHVLATANPKMPGLADWQSVDLAAAADDRPVIDLSALSFTDDREDPDAPPTEEQQMADEPFSTEETAALRALLADLQNYQDQGEGEPDPSGYTEPTDEEMEALAAALLADDNDTPAAAEPAPSEEPAVDVASLSAETGEAIELANTRADRMEIELAQMRAERDNTRYEQLRDRLATEHHIPPRITELAKPVLLGSHTIELADGAQVDAATVMRTVLEAVGDHVKLIDLSAGSDVVYDQGRAEQEQADAQKVSDEMRSYMKTYGL